MSSLITSTTVLESVVQLIVVMLMFIFVVFLAYLAAKIAGSFQGNMLKSQTNIKVIETYRITNNKFIQIVKLGDKYVALAVGKEEINFITELNEETIIIPNEQQLNKMDFKDILTKIKKDNTNKKE